ncbi:MAG: biotin--[acetyl-CoA-carboxylase] ligase [Lentisphaeria bacterium]|nr:biotin--[acetyl-CoA-carboxylase] ligase [Lentisphaeria bacterium]
MIQRTDIIWLAEVDSTNRFALDNFRWFESGTMIAASAQSAGYGTKGRAWLSPPDVNVYASLVLRDFPFPVHSAARIGSLAVLRVLRMHEPGLPLSVKWPNDILCGHKKIAGVLCETRDNGLVIGIGININMDREAALRASSNATSLFIETGKRQPDVGIFVSELRNTALDLLEQARSKGDSELYEEWKSENYLSGRSVSIRCPDQNTVSGLVVDFSPDGAIILVENPSGNIVEIRSGDLLGY